MEIAAFIIFFTILLYEIVKSLLDSIVSVKSLKKHGNNISSPKKRQVSNIPQQKKIIYNNTYNIIITDYETLKKEKVINIK